LGGTPVTVRFDAETRSAVAFDEHGNELLGVTSFWFAWYAFNPETAVFEVN
jgi:ammonia channel protein AmtB